MDSLSRRVPIAAAQRVRMAPGQSSDATPRFGVAEYRIVGAQFGIAVALRVRVRQTNI